jgi:hypothetical protein
MITITTITCIWENIKYIYIYIYTHTHTHLNFKSKIIFNTILPLVYSDLSFVNKVRTLKEKCHYCCVFSEIIKIHSTPVKNIYCFISEYQTD